MNVLTMMAMMMHDYARGWITPRYIILGFIPNIGVSSLLHRPALLQLKSMLDEN
jgi:hypothetical protein